MLKIVLPVFKGKVACIYKIIFPDGSFYIGSTENLRQRISGYKNAFKNSIGSVNKLIASKWLEFNECEFIILEELDYLDNKKYIEDLYIKTHFHNNLCLNRSKSAFSNAGMVKTR